MSDTIGRWSRRATPTLPVILRGTEGFGWSLTGAMAVATALLMAARGLAFDWRSAAPPAAACTMLVAGVIVYRNWRIDERIAASMAGVAQLIAFSAVAATLSYAVTSLGGPLWNETFAGWDKAMGLDWRAYLEAIEARPWLARIYALAYNSLIVQLVVAAAVLGLTGRFVDCRRFAHAVAIAGLLAILLSSVMPAEAMFAHLGLHGGDFPHVDSDAAFTALAPFRGLRAGTLQTISLSQAEGLICFPSFHTALGVIFIAAFWSLRWLRWPAVALNLTLIAATPLNGGHYFVDVIAGAVTAGIAIGAARWLDASASPARRSPAS